MISLELFLFMVGIKDGALSNVGTTATSATFVTFDVDGSRSPVPG